MFAWCHAVLQCYTVIFHGFFCLFFCSSLYGFEDVLTACACVYFLLDWQEMRRPIFFLFFARGL